MIEVSIISPVYKAANIVDKLVEEIVKYASEITTHYEIILVEDGCPENSWEKIEENCKKNNKVKGVKLSRNFGQHFAITAGLTESKGDYVIVMDCDLQDNPKYIIDLVNKAKSGFNIVYTSKLERKHSVFKNTINGSKSIFPTDFFSFFERSSIIGYSYFIDSDFGNPRNFSCHFWLKTKPFFF